MWHGSGRIEAALKRPGSPDSSHEIGQARQIRDLCVTGMFGRFGGFEIPGMFMRDKHAPASRLDGGAHVGLHRIADHHGAHHTARHLFEQAGVNARRLVRHDLDRVEQIAEARLRDLPFLVQKVSLVTTMT